MRQRLKLMINFFALRGLARIDVSDITISFNHALPANLGENAQTARDAMNAGAASVETAVRLLHNGDGWTEDDVRREVERIQAEKVEEAQTLTRDDFSIIENIE